VSTQDALVLQLSSGFGQGLEPEIVKDNVSVQVPSNLLTSFVKFAKEQLGFDMLSSITAVDNVESFELLYHLVSIRPLSTRTIDPAYPGYLQARVGVAKDQDPPEVPSVTPIFPGANLQEREIWDLMGIRFRGHPNLQRILMWEGFPGHPLRKDWVPLNAEIPWHLAGLKGFGAEALADVPATARIADDGSGISQPVRLGTTPEAFDHPSTRPPKPTERLHLKIGQGGLTDYERPDGPARPEDLPPGVASTPADSIPQPSGPPAPESGSAPEEQA
jgi:NADH:ubiquinone oxidoreductase subunit C